MVTVLASTFTVVERNSEHTVTRARHAKMKRRIGAPKQILITKFSLLRTLRYIYVSAVSWRSLLPSGDHLRSNDLFPCSAYPMHLTMLTFGLFRPQEEATEQDGKLVQRGRQADKMRVKSHFRQS